MRICWSSWQVKAYWTKVANKRERCTEPPSSLCVLAEQQAKNQAKKDREQNGIVVCRVHQVTRLVLMGSTFNPCMLRLMLMTDVGGRALRRSAEVQHSKDAVAQEKHPD